MAESRLPVVPLRDIVGYPHMVFPILVGRPRSLSAVQDAMIGSRRIMLIVQKNPDLDDVKSGDLYRVGTVVKILHILRLPDNSMKVLVEGESRARVKKFFFGRDFLEAYCEVIADKKDPRTPRYEALARKTLERFETFVKMDETVPEEVVASIGSSMDDPGRLADMISAHLPLKISEKQDILEAESPGERLTKVLAHLSREIEILKLEQDIDNKVRTQFTESQRESYLREQMEAIRNELGQGASSPEIEALRKRADAVNFPEPVKEKVKEEIDKLERMHPASPEATVVRNYLEWTIDLPWGKYSKDRSDIQLSQKILEEDHYGLEKVKERIIEHIAVMSLSESVRGPILCLVGPPGVGKTSLGKSIARALDRAFVRVSLGGVRDEAEIRGHRKTYVGAMPGRIIQQIHKAGTANPVFLLDEIDKLGTDFRGDPAAALLEALDPEQNKHFVDHYIEVEFDLSRVLFIMTANTTADIPPALLDRMEILRLPGYLLTEKMAIAKGFLIPKSKRSAGLNEVDVRITNEALEGIIREWTEEAGVRELERKIDKIMRTIALRVVKKGSPPQRVDVSVEELEKYLGVAPFKESPLPDSMRVGESLGLAWTSSGGEILRFETAIAQGKEELVLTGRLGEVMRESARAALTLAQMKLAELGYDEASIPKGIIHIHVPEGAQPKEGPSAGIAMTSALISRFIKKPLLPKIAMTGEISLSGRVLRIGGLAEKLVAAKRYEVETVIIPHENIAELSEIPHEAREGLKIEPVKHIDEVLKIVGLIE